MAATTTSTGDLPSTTPQEPQEPPPPSTQTIPSPLIRTSPTQPPPQVQPRPPPPPPPQFLHHPPPRQNHHHPYQTGIFPLPPSIQTQTQTHLLPRFPKPSDMIRYPLASSGRGFHLHRGIHPQLPEPVPSYPLLVNPNHNSRPHPTPIVRFPFIRRPSSQGNVSVSAPAPAPPTAAPSSAVHFNAIHLPSPKVGSSPYTGRESNASKDLTDKKPDDMLVTLRDRKVRVSGGASIYALCRSWLRNGYPEDNQPQHGDVLFSLPKPLPLRESSSPKRKEREDETYFEEVATDDNLDAEELLARHVKRAKRVRARLREERSQRIERYKSRLALLLPSNGTIQE